MNEGLEVDPNPSSFLPLFFVLHNSTNLSTTIYITILSLSKLPPTSDNTVLVSTVLVHVILYKYYWYSGRLVILYLYLSNMVFPRCCQGVILVAPPLLLLLIQHFGPFICSVTSRRSSWIRRLIYFDFVCSTTNM